MVVVGTSAIVYPAAGLPDLALIARHGRHRGQSRSRHRCPRSATISVRETASQALPDLLQRLPALLR